jgi:NAD(P)-dependent dehydrogenase (short-subunit alcohol dehydrogenase family)
MKEAATLGPHPALVKGDVAVDGAQLVSDAIRALGGLDAVVITAGVTTLGRTLETQYEQYQRSMDVQVWGLLEVVRAATSALAERQGAVVAVSGITADLYAKYYGPIGPAKGALETLVRYLAAELGPRGIRVNAVSPCLIADEDHDRPEAVEPFWDQVARRTPLRRLAAPDDIAGAIVALLGADLRFVTGHVLVVDGGYTLLS